MFTIGRLDIGIRTRGAGTPPVPAAPVSSSAPIITGSPLVGSSLSCSTGGWTGFPAPTFTYQWIWADTSANISGATSSTYTPVSGDLGHTLKCAVTATNSQGSATANSNTTAAVASGSGVSPVFTTDFTSLSSLPAGVSFSRASNAMVTDSTGKLTYAPNNLLLQSNNFSDAAWSVSTCTVASGISDPDGGTNASTLTATANGAIFYQQVASDGNFVSSIRIRRRTGTGTVSLRTPDNSNTTPISVTGSWQRLFVSGAAAGGPSYTFAIVLATSGDAVDIYQAQGERVTYETSPRTYNPTTSAAYYGPRFDHAWNGSAWVATGLLIEEQRTNLLLQSADLSNAAWTAFGLTISSDTTVAPDGSTALKMVSTGGSSGMYSTNPVSITGGGATYTYSIFFKKGAGNFGCIDIQDSAAPTTNSFTAVFDLSGTADTTASEVLARGNGVIISTKQTYIGGWFRCQVTGTLASATGFYFVPGLAPLATGNSFDGSGFPLATASAASIYMFGPQAGAGTFITSYIPTTSAAVTRSADIPSASSPLTGYLAAGPSVWEFQDEATGTIARAAYAAGAFDWPVNKWYRSMGVYPAGTDTSGHMVVGSGY